MFFDRSKIFVIVIILTISVVVINPKMHKGIMITNSSDIVYKTDKTLKKYDNQNFINIDNLKNSDIKVNNINNLSISNHSINDEQKYIDEYRRRKLLPKTPTVYEYKSENYDYEENQPKIVLDSNNDEISKIAENIKENIETEDVENLLKELQQKNIIQEPDKKNKPKNKTEYEETIIWNKWKSDFHNKIHKDLANSLPEQMPLGAFYKYSFVIDKYGKIYNINVKLLFRGLVLSPENEEALKKGISVFKNVIANSGNRHFNGFPEGSQRKFVKLELVVQMGFVNVYTNPSDFNDLEKVLRFR